MLNHLIRFVRHLKSDTSGLALIEFAYTLPIFLGFGLVGIEFTNVVLAQQKSERVASTLADQIASNQLPPSEEQIKDMFIAVAQISKPFEFAPEGNAILTAVIGVYDAEDDEIQNKVAWQRCIAKDSFESNIGDEWTATNDISEGPEVTLPNSLKLSQNQMVIVSEVFFPYKEIVSAKLVEGMLPNNGIFRQTSTFRTRGPALLDVTPVPSIAKHEC
ncbi:MAG: TadE/TadG family type IV pilus assembly protein [Erythrobacter sp.]